VEKASGQPYEEFIRKNVLEPAGVKRAFLNKVSRNYFADEAHRYLAGTSIMLPPMELPMVRAAGGWSTTAVDMVRFLTAVDGSRGKPLLKEATFKQMLAPPPAPLKPRANGTYNGLGWPTVTMTAKGFGYLHDGSYHGMRTFMKRSPQGVNWVLLFNVSMEPDPIDAQITAKAVQEIRQQVESLQKYPDIDLFPQFP
jgi:N-acyl-D-amino-acid deacylase